MSFENSQKTMGYFHRLGAEFITLVGGEPTLHPDLPKIVSAANEIGYTKVMIDTNGLQTKALHGIPVEHLYYVRVSLDGPTRESHDLVRGPGTFEKAVDGIRELISLGFNIRITSTVFSHTVEYAESMLELADQLGVAVVNFHSFSEEGLGLNNLSWSLAPRQWMAFCRRLEGLKGKHIAIARYPPTWVHTDNMEQYVAQGYKGCLGCSLDRVSVFPDGRCHVCSVMFDQPLNFAQLTESGLELNKSENEFEMFVEAVLSAEKPELSGCPAEKLLPMQGKGLADENIVSVCRLWRAET
jgi:MoaA/NifB/PqqE/SkfB family radical SAM enzyme